MTFLGGDRLAHPIAPGDDFRSYWRGLDRAPWFNTPSIAPLATPVADALAEAIDGWGAAEFSIEDWEGEMQACRELIAGRLQRPPESVSLVGSLAEAATIVAGSVTRGRLVVSAEDYRSNLFPWLALSDRGVKVVEVAPRDGMVQDEDLIQAIDSDTTLVAFSAVTSWDGHRRDCRAITEAAHAAGARVFANLTQSEGVLRSDFGDTPPEYVAGHAYKWLLSPRGTGYLSVRADSLEHLAPLIPSWRTPSDPYAEYFGGPIEMAADASRLDSPPVWLSWIGARAGLELVGRLDAAATEEHCIALASECHAALTDLGFEPMASTISHIVSARTEDAAAYAAALVRDGVMVAANHDRFRVGFHAFNTHDDLARLVAALERVVGARG